MLKTIRTRKIMGVLKLSVIEEQIKKEKANMKVAKEKKYHVGACDCPCWAFLKKGDVVASDDVEVGASWNID